MINAHQLLTYVIEPTLQDIGLYSHDAARLLLGTAAQESHLGHYIYQIPSGPAVGIYQMEPATHDDIWDNYLRYGPELGKRIRRLVIAAEPEVEQMAGNLYYATAMCRLHYLRVPEPLPSRNDEYAMAAYWKAHYNTVRGKGTVEEFVTNYKRFVV